MGYKHGLERCGNKGAGGGPEGAGLVSTTGPDHHAEPTVMRIRPRTTDPTGSTGRGDEEGESMDP